MSREEKIVSFPTKAEEISPEERARRLGVEVDRLAALPMVEWMLYLPDTAKKHGIAQTKLKAMVERTIRKREKPKPSTTRGFRSSGLNVRMGSRSCVAYPAGNTKMDSRSWPGVSVKTLLSCATSSRYMLDWKMKLGPRLKLGLSQSIPVNCSMTS